MNPNTPRLQAQEAANWYMSHLDPYTPHSENVVAYLKGPLLAVTLNALHHTPLDPAGGEISADCAAATTNTANAPSKDDPHLDLAQEEEKKSSGDWRDYLYTTTSSPHDLQQQQQQLTNFLNDKGHAAYEILTRRGRARMEAFLAGTILAVPTEFVSSSSTVPSTKKKGSPKTPATSSPFQKTVVSLEDGLAGFQIFNKHSNHKEEKKSEQSSPPSSVAAPAPAKKNPLPPLQKQQQSQQPKPLRLSSVTQQGKTLIRNISNSIPPTAVKHPQIAKEQLIVRLELYIRSLLRVRTLQEECVVAMEPPKSLKARARYITSSFVVTAGCVRSMSPVLTRLLTCLTKELLAVDTLAEEIVKVIRRVSSEYEHQTSFASLAFLSSPEVSADSHLTPLIIKYLRYLQSEWEELLQKCELERILSRALDPSMRKFFKTIEFRSIGHLLEVCQQYRSALRNVELAPTLCAGAENVNNLSSCPVALNQALRDLRREIITVNGHVLPPVTSRKDLIHLLSQTLNSRTLTAFPPPSSVSTRKHDSTTDKKNMSANVRRSESLPNMTIEQQATEAKVSSSLRKQPSPLTVENNNSDGEIFITSSEYDSASDQNGVTRKEHNKTRKDEKHRNPPTRRKPRRAFHLSTIDLLTRRLLIAASRTGMGGDAYFIVRDLFGGEDVEVVPSSPTYSIYDPTLRPGTIDIIVRLASVTIKCHASFDVYPKSLVGECEPLIQFHTTTTETISLQEVRSADSSDDATIDDSSGSDDSSSGDHPRRAKPMVVQERQTPKTGWRTISIRPALYEKVEVWNTPS